jgi:hypothetical protein
VRAHCRQLLIGLRSPSHFCDVVLICNARGILSTRDIDSYMSPVLEIDMVIVVVL